MNDNRIACWIIGGYLGAGKTTLVNFWLRHANGLRIAVLVNDFGDLPIDADLIEGQHGNVMTLSGGCVCCSFGADLVGSLQQVVSGQPPPDLVLIETSGVGLPTPVARSAKLVANLLVQSKLVVVDGDSIRQRLQDKYVGDVVKQQIDQADWLVLNKTDLIDTAVLPELYEAIQSMNPRARVISAERGQIALDSLMLSNTDVADVTFDAAESFLTSTLQSVANTLSANDIFVSESRSWTGEVDVARLTQSLGTLNGLVRAKGIVHDAQGQAHEIQAVGARIQVSPARSDSSPNTNRLVIIGLRHEVNLKDFEYDFPA